MATIKCDLLPVIYQVRWTTENIEDGYQHVANVLVCEDTFIVSLMSGITKVSNEHIKQLIIELDKRRYLSETGPIDYIAWQRRAKNKETRYKKQPIDRLIKIIEKNI